MRQRLTRAERRGITREDLIGAAERLFTGQGFHATSVDEVALEAGYTKGAACSSFKSKEDLFFAVYERGGNSPERTMRLTRLADRVEQRKLVTGMARERTRAEDSLRVVAGGRGDGPSVVPAGAKPPPGGNLPLELTSFVGRERELEEVRGLLAQTRLLTLTGPGGCGKTRLALAVASALAEEFDDGVWWVGLASLSDPDLVLQRVASSLDVREAAGRTLTETLADHLKTRETLLLLDNCEHLIEACATLADTLLRACPHLRVLATSREALGVAGERAWLVPSLSLPGPGHPPTVEEMTRYEAVRLFVERAVTAASSFAPTEQNAPAVARLCRRLDGIPLAIELAAARTRVLSVEQIDARLDDCFKLLKTDSRTALPRQRTLRAAIDWSHELLSGDERLFFRRLSVFAGGFTLEAAEEVCAGDGLQPDDVLELLSRLVDKSLVVVRQRDDEARYRLLETVRQYGREKLRSSGEAEGVRRRHADFFLGLAEEAEPRVMSAERSVWLAYLEAEHDNFRAALRWTAEAGEAETGLRLAGALWGLWFHRGHHREGLGWFEEVLANAKDDEALTRTAARAWALLGAGTILWSRGDRALSRSRLEESVGIWRELEGGRKLAHALYMLSMELLAQGEPDAARSLAGESVEILRGTEDEFAFGMSLACLGIVAVEQRDYTAAASALEESAAVFRQARDDWGLSVSLRHLGNLAFRRGDHDRAASVLEESLSVARGPGDKLYTSRSIEILAAVTEARGDHARAARLFGAGEGLREAVGSHVLIPYRDDYDRGVAAARTGLDEETFAKAWSEGRKMTLEEAIAFALEERSAVPARSSGGLSAREIEVLSLVAEGLSDAEVAGRLYVSPRTVSQHLRSVYRKLGVSSRTAAIKSAGELGLI